MSTIAQTQRVAGENVIPLPVRAERARPQTRDRFQVQPFENKSKANPTKTVSTSWRVTGIKRDGSRVRANFTSKEAADAEKTNLMIEWLAGHQPAAIRQTRLTDDQLRIAETAFARLNADMEMLPAIEYWLRHGRQVAVAESPRLDEAVQKFKEWLPVSGLRKLSQKSLRIQTEMFSNSTPNLRVADISTDTIQEYLEKRKVSLTTRANGKRALSRFFSWCIQRPRRWCAVNPCRELQLAKSDKTPPAILTVEQCQKLLTAAEDYRGGIMLPYTVACLFGGLRPYEAQRLHWEQVNLSDLEIRIEAHQSKVKRPRVVSICPTLAAWLKACKDIPFCQPNHTRRFIAVKALAFGKGQPLAKDILRHTGISHYFRKTGSYGQAAEQFGNSEQIIKLHYQGRVTTEDTAKFYALRPAKRSK
jgi:integrase